MMLTVVVGVAAALGAVARYIADQSIQARHDRPFPFGTLAVNVSGSFLLALTTGLASQHGLDADVALVVGTGFAGGYTTWSTYAWESLALAEAGSLVAAGLNIVASLAAGLLAAAAGFGLALAM